MHTRKNPLRGYIVLVFAEFQAAVAMLTLFGIVLRHHECAIVVEKMRYWNCGCGGLCTLMNIDHHMCTNNVIVSLSTFTKHDIVRVVCSSVLSFSAFVRWSVEYAEGRGQVIVKSSSYFPRYGIPIVFSYLTRKNNNNNNIYTVFYLQERIQAL